MQDSEADLDWIRRRELELQEQNMQAANTHSQAASPVPHTEGPSHWSGSMKFGAWGSNTQKSSFPVQSRVDEGSVLDSGMVMPTPRMDQEELVRVCVSVARRGVAMLRFEAAQTAIANQHPQRLWVDEQGILLCCV